MSGNVWEWCEDKYHDNYKNAPKDGSAWIVDGISSRVLRGGFWGSTAYGSRKTNRYSFESNNGGNGVGFRLVCS